MPSVRAYINDFLGTQLDNFLHKNSAYNRGTFGAKFYKLKKNAKNFQAFVNWRKRKSQKSQSSQQKN